MSRTATMPIPDPTDKRAGPRRPSRIPPPRRSCSSCPTRRCPPSSLPSLRAPFAAHASSFVRSRQRDFAARAAGDASTGAKGARVQPNNKVHRRGAAALDEG